MSASHQKGYFTKPVLFGFFVFCLLMSLTQYLSYQKYLLNKNLLTEQISDAANLAKSHLQTSLHYSLSTTKTLAFIVSRYGTPTDFDNVAASLMGSNPHIDAVELVSAQGVITHVFPFKGNENLMGYNILEDSTRNKEAFKAIKKGELFFAGPFMLKQGGMGVVGRQAIYKDGKFDGFAAVVIRLSELIDATGIDPNNTKGLVYQLSKINPDTGQEEFFLDNAESFDKTEAVSVAVPNGEWLLYAKKKNGTLMMSVLPFAIFGLLFSVIGGGLAWYLLKQPEELSLEIAKKTTQLELVLDSISDGFIALDKDWNYTYVNEKGARLFDRHTPEKLVGRNLWALFPHFHEQPFYKNYKKVMDDRQPMRIMDYYEPWDKHFENRIYPSDDGGITIFCNDITENIKNEHEIRKSQEALNKIMDSSVDIICTFDPDGNFIEVSAAAFDVLGYTPEELKGRNYREFVSPEDMELSITTAEEISSGIDKTNFENHYISKDGKVVPLIWSARWDEKEQLMFCIAKDATEREEAEKLRHLTEQRFRSLVQEGSDLIGVMDSDGMFMYKSPSSMAILGLPPEEFVGKDAFSFVHPDDVAAVREEFEGIVQQKRIRMSPFRYRHGDGGWRWLATTITDLTDDPAVRGIVANSRDVTQNINALQSIRDSEERYRYLFENNPQPMYIFDMETLDIVECNRRIVTKYGYSREEFLSFKITDFRPDEDKALVLEALDREQFFSSDQQVIWRHLKKNGELMHVQVTANIIDFKGRRSGLVLIDDVTVRLSHLQAIEKQNEKLQQIAWIQSHIVRAPLTRIMGLADYLKNHNTTDQERLELLSHILASAEEFDDIIKDIIEKAHHVKHGTDDLSV